MEIVIDAALVGRILSEEADLASREIRSVGPLRALAASQRRHDGRIAAAPDVATLDCRAGCAWCCHFSVDVRAAEVFAIVDFVAQTFTDEQKASLRAATCANRRLLQDLSEVERMTRNVRCPFLTDGNCAIYPVRPQTCRNYHATDVTGCRRSFEHPDDLDIDPEFAPAVYQAGTAHVEAFSAAMRDAGFDVDAYELNAALDAALADPAARARFAARSVPFLGLQGVAVPEEYDDLEEL